MDKRKLLLMLAALAVAIVTALAARDLYTGGAVPEAAAAAQPIAGPKVLVARRALPVGTILTADSVSFQPWPNERVGDAYFLEGATDTGRLLGTVVRYAVPAGQPMTKGALVAPGDRGFLAAALAPGMRAVTIAVPDKTGGVGGFIFPGDHVDLLLTQTVAGAGSESQSLRATETFLTGVRVLATDQSAESGTADGKTVVVKPVTVTLEVTPQMAEKIEVAGTIGAISLALRSIADTGAPAMATLGGRGSYVTGGDVSRFQRRTMPLMTAPAPVVFTAPSIPAYPALSARGSAPIVNVTRGKQVEAVAMPGQ